MVTNNDAFFGYPNLLRYKRIKTHSKIRNLWCVHENLHKSISAFRFWTFFLSFFQKPKYFSAKSHAKNEV